MCAELKTIQAGCQPNHPLADIAIVEVQLGDPNSLFIPLPNPGEEPGPIPAPAAAPAPAKVPVKAPAVKAPVAKGSGAKGAAAAAADQSPPVGAPDLGRALELLAAQVQEYCSWRERTKVLELPAVQLVDDDMAEFKAILQDTPQVCLAPVTVDLAYV